MDDRIYPISELQERYSLSAKQSVYDRIKALGINPVARGKLSGGQLDLLDSLHEWLKANPNKPIADFPHQPEVLQIHRLSGGDLSADFTEPSKSTDLSTNWVDKSADKSESFRETLELIDAIASHFTPKSNPLAHYEALEQAIEHRWLLTSFEVAQLTGVKPKGERFERGSFIFDRTGKIGCQYAWKVTKKLFYE